jgi:hypothetical protein
MTAYKFNFDNAQEGHIADSSIRRIDSYPAATNLSFGKVIKVEVEVITGSLFAEPWTFNEYPFGITVYDPTQINGYYQTNTMASILSFGRIFVKCEDDIIAGQLAYIDSATGNITGIFGVTHRAIGIFLTSGLTGELLVLQFQPSIT